MPTAPTAYTLVNGPAGAPQLGGVVYTDANNALASVVTPFYIASSNLLIPAIVDAVHGIPGTLALSQNTPILATAQSVSNGAAAGTAFPLSVPLPATIPAEGRCVVIVMNPPNAPQGVTATVGTSGTVGSYLAANTTYYYGVTTVSAQWGETTLSTVVSATEGATPYPVTLTWDAVTGAATYNVYKGTSATTLTQLVSGLTTTSYTDTGNTATSTTAPPTSATQGCGSPLQVVPTLAIKFGGNTTYPIALNSFTVNIGSVSVQTLSPFLIGDSDPSLICTITQQASTPSGSFWIEVLTL